jgi:hypothetical protein
MNQTSSTKKGNFMETGKVGSRSHNHNAPQVTPSANLKNLANQTASVAQETFLNAKLHHAEKKTTKTIPVTFPPKSSPTLEKINTTKPI